MFLRGGGNSHNLESGGKGRGRRSEEYGLAAAENLVKRFQNALMFLIKSIANKAKWLGSPANIKGANKDANTYRLEGL